MLDSIRSHFLSNQTGPPPCVILHALGGQGKSQIALEYCRKWRETYRGVFWINANSEMTATQSYGTIAAELTGASKFETSDSAAQIRLVTGNLERWREVWLLVFDNYDDPESFTTEIRSFFPTSRLCPMFMVEYLLTRKVEGHGHLLFTSRNRDLSRLGTLLEIPPMEIEDGVRLLLRSYNDNDIQRSHKDMASSIVERLGNLALAIDQAAAYIKYKRLLLDRLGDFLTIYEAERKKVLTYTPRNWEYKHVNAFTTWELSFRQLISGNNPWKTDVAHFLTLSAFFAPTRISESLFRFYQRAHGSEVRWIQMFSTSDVAEEDRNEHSHEENDKASTRSFDGSCNDEWSDVSSNDASSDSICDDEWSADQFWDIIAKSDDLSLLQSISQAVGDQSVSFSLHPVIRDWLQLRLTEEERQEYTQEAILVLGCYVKTYIDRSSTSLEERTALTAHMDVSISNDEKFSKSQDKLGGNIANCNTASLFADFYRRQGRYRISEDLHRRLVETRRSRSSEKHRSTLTSMKDLAFLLDVQGKYGDAEQIYRQTLSFMETELGEMHSDTLDCMRGLASSLSSQKKHGEAESIYRSILELREKKRKKDDSSIVLARWSLAMELGYQGRYDEAEEIHQSTLFVQGKTLGKGHPDILHTMVYLAEAQVHQGKYEEAEWMCRQTLRMQETIVGKESPDILNSLNVLTRILSKQGKHEEAEKVCRRRVAMQETQIGKEHPDTLFSMLSLIWTLRHQNKYDEAEQMCRQTLVLNEKLSGLGNPTMLKIMESLGGIMETQSKYEEAESLYRKILMLRKNVSGPEHPVTLKSMEDLGRTLHQQGMYKEAESLYRKIMTSREGLLGSEHPDTLHDMETLAWVLKKQGEHEKAKSFCQQTLMVRERVLGKDHPDTLWTMELLDDILAEEGNDEDAEQISPENAT